MRKLKKSLSVFIAVAALLALWSCAAMVPLRISRPPSIDMTGVKSVGIAGFSRQEIDISPLVPDTMGSIANAIVNSILDANNPYSQFEREAAALLRSAFTDAFLSSGRFTVIDLAAVSKSGGLQAKMPDAYVSGTLIKCDTTEKWEEEVNKAKDGTVTKVPVFKRTVRLEFSYRVVESETGRLLGEKSKSDEQASVRKGTNALKDAQSASELLRQAVNTFNPEIRKEILPWTDTRYVALVRDKENERMMAAERLAKNGNYAAAKAAYVDIYLKEGLFGAGFNATVIQFYLGDREGAAVAMKALADRTGDRGARAESEQMLVDIRDERAAALIGIN